MHIRHTVAVLALTLTGIAATTPAASVGQATMMADGCNHYTCIEAGPNSARTGMVKASWRWNRCWPKSHFHFWGPGFDFNTRELRNCSGRPPTETRWFGPFKRGTYCVEGWFKDGFGAWHSIGLPCVTI
ncbi:hypothetical protein ACFWYW_58070 [Nonomuraea sp. NPDC059023]|uniref:hypothetical protein n=1 Tax=unclassified Nonomuraea TaxID=2593643 RepID=UPI00369D5CA3